MSHEEHPWAQWYDQAWNYSTGFCLPSEKDIRRVYKMMIEAERAARHHCTAKLGTRMTEYHLALVYGLEADITPPEATRLNVVTYDGYCGLYMSFIETRAYRCCISIIEPMIDHVYCCATDYSRVARLQYEDPGLVDQIRDFLYLTRSEIE